MNYIYDILLNFNENLYNFYDWNMSDNITHIRKIPLVKVNNKTYKDICSNLVEFKSEFLEKINRKTEIFTNRDIKILPYAFLISNGIEVMAINIGNNIKKSKLLIDEEYEVIDMCKRLEYSEIEYKIIKPINNYKFKTRKDIEMEKYLIKELKKLYKEKNTDKLKYLFYECFDKKEEDINIIIETINKNMKNCFDTVSDKLYKFFKLVQLSK